MYMGSQHVGVIEKTTQCMQPLHDAVIAKTQNVWKQKYIIKSGRARRL